MIHVAFDLRDPERSGIARVASSLARALAASLDREPSNRFTLCGPLGELERMGARSWSRQGVHLVNWPGGRHSAQSQIHWNTVRRQAADATWFFPHWDVPWFALPRRYVVMVHDLILLRVPDATTPARRLLARHWIQHAVARAARIVVPSRSTARDLATLLPSAESRTVVITEGVEPRFFASARPPALPPDIAQFAAGQPFMLSVGNRKRHKNLSPGVELLSKMSSLRWIVVGERYAGWDDIERRAANAGVSGRMLVLDRCSDDVLCALYAHALCLFFPSRMEGWGLPVVEAIASGTPVVCSNAGSLPEAAGSCAILCDPDDTPGFERAIQALLSAPRRQPVECVDRVRGMTWASAAEQLLHVIQEVA